MKEIGNDRIMIKKKYKYFRFILVLLILISASMLSGALFSKRIVKNMLKESSIYDYEKNDFNVNEVVSKGITTVSHSIVTISDSPEKLTVNVQGDGNVTGVVIDEQGYIVTSFSKISKMKNILVKFPSLAKEPVSAVLIGADEEADVAVIRVDSDGLVPIAIQNGDEKERNLSIAVGNSISNDYIGMVTVGVISSINSKVYEAKNKEVYKVIQTSAAINDENIGGALCNVKGELIGFNSYTLNKDVKVNQLYNVLSAEDLKSIVNNIIRLTDRIGISGQMIDDEKSGVRGLYIQNVTPNGVAAKAGLLPTDIIMSIGEKNILSLEDVNESIKNQKTGEKEQCEVLRDGKKIKVEILFD